MSSKKIEGVKCYHSHPEYVITDDDGSYTITGGTCTKEYPDVDLFIGFDWAMTKGEREFPWVEGIDIHYIIKDGSVPTKPESFKKLIAYTADALREGKSVHCGCIGGHGRTGLFLAALTAHMTGDVDAIKTVRENYCEKAVETTTQVEFLMKHFGVNEEKGSYAMRVIDGGWAGTATGRITGLDPEIAELPRHRDFWGRFGKGPKLVTENKRMTLYSPVEGHSEFELKK